MIKNIRCQIGMKLAIGFVALATATGLTACSGGNTDSENKTTTYEQSSEVESSKEEETNKQEVVPYTYEDGVLTVYYTKDVIDKQEEWRKYSKEARKVVLSEGIWEIYNGTFEGWENLEEIVLPESLRTLGWDVFKDCVKLNNVVLPENVKSVSMNAFAGCTSLSNITLSSEALSINNHAFYNCISLEDIVLPSTINRIDEFAFENSPVDAKINLPINIMRRQPIDKSWVDNMIKLLQKDDFKQVEKEMKKLDADTFKNLIYYGNVYRTADGTKLGIRARANEDGTFWWAVYYIVNDEHWTLDVVGYMDKYYDSDGTYCNGNEAFGPGMLSPWKLDEKIDIWMIWSV